MDKIYQNINVLDMTTATEQALDGVSMMENVNVLLFSKATSGLLSSITQQNVNVRAEVPANSQLSQANGRYEIGSSFGNENPMFIVVNGTLIIRPDAAADELAARLAGIIVNGSILCPEQMKGILQQKITQHNGHLSTYMDGASLVEGNVTINNTYLSTLQSGSTISFSGNVVMTESIDASLLEDKLHKAEFLNKLVICEELLPSVSGKIVNAHKCKIVNVPRDTYYCDGNLNLDAGALTRMQQKSIYVTGTLQIESDVTPELLHASINSLHSEKTVICPMELRNEVMSKIPDPAVQILGYQGKLRTVDGEYKLTSSELSYSKEPLSFIVHGILDISPAIAPQLLFDSLGSLINYGVINASGEQCGIVQTKLLRNQGIVSDRDSIQENDDVPEETTADANHIYIRNMNYLKL